MCIYRRSKPDVTLVCFEPLRANSHPPSIQAVELEAPDPKPSAHLPRWDTYYAARSRLDLVFYLSPSPASDLQIHCAPRC
jgi:hypothetical protein